MQFLKDCDIYIRYQNLPLPELFAQLAEHYPEFDFWEKLTFNFDNLPEQIWENALTESNLPKEACNILIHLGNELGKTDISGQIAILDLYQRQMQNVLENYQTECGKKSRLFRSLGWLGGAMLIILFI